MVKNSMEYMKNDEVYSKVIRTEIFFTPILIVLPLIISILLINDWYVRGYLEGSPAYNGELFLGLIILFGNILFDIPFVKSLKELSKK